MDEGERDDFDEWASYYTQFYPAGSRLDLEFRTSRLLVLASRNWTYRVDAALRKETGQSRSRWQVLFAIAFAEQPATMTEISHRARVKWSTLLRVSQEMERDGLIVRNKNTADLRSKLLSLTPEGERILALLQPTLDRERAELLGAFTSDELHTCEKMMRTIFEAAIRPPTPLSSLAAT